MTKAWLLNTNPNHWDHCVQGPRTDDHPEEHHGHPWHGIPESRNALDPRELSEGDLLIIRETGEGVRAIWSFREARKVVDQSILPGSWRDHGGEIRDYRWIIYCRGEPIRELDNILEEKWEQAPNIKPQALTGTAKKGSSVIEAYIDFLLEKDIPESAKERLREASNRKRARKQGARWSRDEFIVTLDAYFNKHGYIGDKDDSRVQELASIIGRSPESVVSRLGNYMHLDPNGEEGMAGTGEPCRQIWEEYYGNEDELGYEAGKARNRLESPSGGGRPYDSAMRKAETWEGETITKVRQGQADFRSLVREKYEDSCILCSISDPGLLQASHILDWSEFEELRGDPANGLLLCYNHHRAFDLNMFTISPDYRITVRPGFNPSSEFLKQTITEREGEVIEFPTGRPPVITFRLTTNDCPGNSFLRSRNIMMAGRD